MAMSSARRPGSAPRPEASTEKSSTTRSPDAVGDEHVAAGAQAGQERLGDERGQQRRQGGVDGVAARAQDVCAGLRGQRVSCGDYPRGMNSGTSRSARLRLARVGRSRRLMRGSPRGSSSPRVAPGSSLRRRGVMPSA